jgi:hypothetical protein
MVFPFQQSVLISLDGDISANFVNVFTHDLTELFVHYFKLWWFLKVYSSNLNPKLVSFRYLFQIVLILLCFPLILKVVSVVKWLLCLLSLLKNIWMKIREATIQLFLNLILDYCFAYPGYVNIKFYIGQYLATLKGTRL